MEIRYSCFLLIGLALFWGNFAHTSWWDSNRSSKSEHLKTPLSIKSPEGREAYERLREFADASNVWGVENTSTEYRGVKTYDNLPPAIITIHEIGRKKEPRIVSLLPKANGHVDEVEFNPNYPGPNSEAGKIVVVDLWKDGQTHPGKPEFFVNRQNNRHEWYTFYEGEDGNNYKQMFEYVNHKARFGEIKTIYIGVKPENELHVMVAKEDTSTSESIKLTLVSGFRVLLAIPEENSSSESTSKAKRLAVYTIRKDPVTGKEGMTKFVFELEKGPGFNQVSKEEVSDSTRESFLVSKKSHNTEVSKEGSQPSRIEGSK